MEQRWLFVAEGAPPIAILLGSIVFPVPMCTVATGKPVIIWLLCKRRLFRRHAEHDAAILAEIRAFALFLLRSHVFHLLPVNRTMDVHQLMVSALRAAYYTV